MQKSTATFLGGTCVSKNSSSLRIGDMMLRRMSELLSRTFNDSYKTSDAKCHDSTYAVANWMSPLGKKEWGVQLLMSVRERTHPIQSQAQMYSGYLTLQRNPRSGFIHNQPSPPHLNLATTYHLIHHTQPLPTELLRCVEKTSCREKEQWQKWSNASNRYMESGLRQR